MSLIGASSTYLRWAWLFPSRGSFGKHTPRKLRWNGRCFILGNGPQLKWRILIRSMIGSNSWKDAAALLVGGARGHQVDREAQFGLLREAIEVITSLKFDTGAIAHGSILRRIFPKQYGVTMLGLSVVRSRTRLVILIATTRASFGPHPSAPRENPA